MRRGRGRKFSFGANTQNYLEREPYGFAARAEPAQVNVEEKLASLFEPDRLASAQYFDNLRRKTILEPEKRLILAVLEDAVNCFQTNVFAANGKAKRLFNETEEWVMEQAGDWVFSFQNVCETLGLNPRYVRQGLMRWKQKQLDGQPNQSIREETRMAV
jgi:hypothetical protein